jgi:hypothetical protein
MAEIYKMNWTFRDAQGRTSLIRANVSTIPADIQTVADQWVTLWQAASTANVRSFLDVPGPIVRPAAALYQSVQDKAELVFQDVGGSFHRYQIPCPIGGGGTPIFMGDGVTVNPANAAIVAIVSQAIDQFTSATGAALSLFLGGIRLRRRLPRRLNITVLAPDDVSPAE